MATNQETAMVKRESETSLVNRSQTIATVAPPADIYESDDAYVLILDMPGATKESISISLDKMTLTIRGTADATREQFSKVLYNEIRGGVYQRVFNLTDGIDRNNIEANFADCVLTIKLLKKEEVKPKTIQIR